MSTVAAPVAARRRLRFAALAESADVRALGLLGLLLCALVVATWATWGDVGSDTGYDLVAGSRLAHGQLPYVDYTYYYGPLAPALVALADVLFGTGLAAAFVLGIFITAAIVAATYVLARFIVGPAGAFAAASLTAAVAFAPNNLSYVLPYTESTTLAVLFTLVTLIALARMRDRASTRAAVVAGTAAGLVALTRPEFEIAVLAALVVAGVLAHRAGTLRRMQMLALAGPALGIPAVVYGVFAALTSPSTLVFSNLYPRRELRAGGTEILKTQAPFTIHSFVSIGGKLVLYAVGVALLVAAGRALATRLRMPVLVALVGAAVLFLAVLAAKPETIRHALQFVYGWIPAGALVAVAILGRRALRDRKAPADALLLAVVLAVLGLKTYAAFFFFAPNPQYAVFAAPFAAIFLARLHVGELVRGRQAAVIGVAWVLLLATAGTALAVKDARAKSARVDAPHGTIAVAPAQAQAFQSAVAWIDGHTTAHEPILVAPELTSLYTLTGRTDPLREIQLLPIALPRAQDERAAIAALTKARVRLAIVDRRTYPEYGHTFFGGSFDRLVAGWLHHNFKRVAVLGSASSGRVLDVWWRSAP